MSSEAEPLSRPEDKENEPKRPVLNDSWYGKPIEEVDPSIFDDTFCVISPKFHRYFIYRYSSSKSLFLFGPLNPIRRFAIFVTTHRWFDVLIILTILCNCVTLAMITNIYDPATGEHIVPAFQEPINNIEYIFLGIFTLELVLKVIAKGLVFNKFSYMRNRWNFLDLVVVASGYITLQDSSDSALQDDNGLDFLRTFRVLRVVKTISIMPGLKMMINALLSSIVHLLEVMALTGVCLMIFSLFSLEIFQGRLRQKCVLDKGGPEDAERAINRMIADEPPEDRDRIWTEWVSDWRNWKRRAFPEDEPQFCGNKSYMRSCGPGYTCIAFLGDNPDNGWTSFDTFFNAMLSTFQLLTLDYWERLYDIVLSTCGLWSLFFFLVVIFLGAYYLLNLMLAVVAMSYENEVYSQDQGPMSVPEKLALNQRKSNFSFEELSKINVCKMTHYKKRTKSERDLLAKRIKNLQMPDDTEEGHDETKNIHLDDAIFSLLGMRLAINPAIERGGSIDESLQKEMEILPLSAQEDDTGRYTAPTSDVEIDLGADLNTSQMSRLSTSFGRCKIKFAAACKKHFLPIVNHFMFETFITICIILNTIALAMEHHGQSREQEDLLKMFNHVFMAVFTTEAILKMLALQGEYFKTGWNVFDLIIVSVSYFDLIASEITSTGGSNGQSGSRGLSVIRSMRLLRVFKLAQSWVTMKILLNIIFSSFGALGNLTCVLLIVIYIFAVMGMQIIGQNYTPAAFNAIKSPDEFPKWHWRHFWYAFMMVFRVLCGEWIETLWHCLKAQQHHLLITNESGKGSKIFSYAKCFLIFFPILVIGNFIVLNLFLALLLNSFDTEELNAQRDKELEASGKAENLKNIVGLLMKKEPTHEEETETVHEQESERESTAGRGRRRGGRGEKMGSMSKTGVVGTRTFVMHSLPESAARRRFKAIVNRVILRMRIEAAERAIARMENRRKRQASGQLSIKLFLGNPRVKDDKNEQYDKTPDVSDVSQELTVAGDCFPARVWQSRFCPCRSKTIENRRQSFFRTSRRWDTMRSICVAIVSHQAFEWSILSLIFASSITLCFEDIHLETKPTLKQALCNLNYAFTAVFLVEMILKWLAIGIYGYFTNFWTILDGFIVSISLVSVYFDVTLDTCSQTTARTGAAANLGALKALRTLRALRPLRAISRWQGMKIVVNALMYAIPSIFNVLLVCLLFWLIFSIMAVQFFKGQFYRCVNENGERVDWRIAPNKDVCCAKSITYGYSWVNTISNYDNVFEGYLSLLQVATFEGWMELMSYSVDAVGVDKQPVTDYQIGYYAFYVVFIVFGSFFSLQLFIGVIIDNFNMLKKKYEGNVLEVLLTPSQRNYYIAMKNLGKKKPRPVILRSTNKFLGFFYDIATSRKLEVIIFIMIFFNMVVKAAEAYGQPQRIEHLLACCNAFFTTVYCLEALIKIIGLGSFYFTIPWNVYDFMLVAISLIDAFEEGDLSVSLPVPPTMLRIVRVFRIGKILRLIKGAQGIRKLLYALIVSLPALFNIGALLALITFIYAILGMTLFGKAPRKWSVDDVFNFETFLNSNLMLLRLMTAAGWNEVLESLTVLDAVCGTYRHIECGFGDEPECPNRALVVAYIVSYLILTYLIVINLYIAIILENYVEASNEEDLGIVEDDLEMFYVRWSRYDPYATQFIDFENLSDFLDSLDPPLQLVKPNIVAIVAFNLPIARGYKLHCLDILQSLITHVLGQVDDSREFRKLQSQMELKFHKQFPTRRLLDIVSSTRRWKIENNAAIIIQRTWRAYYKRTHPVPSKIPSSTKQRNRDPNEDDHGGLGHMMDRMENTPSKISKGSKSISKKKKEKSRSSIPENINKKNVKKK